MDTEARRLKEERRNVGSVLCSQMVRLGREWRHLDSGAFPGAPTQTGPSGSGDEDPARAALAGRSRLKLMESLI